MVPFHNIFIPFHKGSRTCDTGIGLAIVRKVAHACGGSVRAYNDRGACFEVTLRDWPESPREATESGGGRKPTILPLPAPTSGVI
jgi:K+-sensing histidine kinase KdpD